MNIKIGSLFDGIGGTLLSAQLSGSTPVWASEIEPVPISITKRHFPDVKHYGDITKINGAKVEPVDIIVGGSPCQDLSVAGKRAGLAGERSGLFMEQVRIVKEMREHDRATGRSTESIRPRFMVWENVPGAFSSNGGEDFRAVLEETARIADETVTIPRPRDNKWNTAGAIMGRNFSIAWRVLDAQYWGVPQRRRRIYLVADFGGHSAGEILFKCESVSGDIAESGAQGERVAGGVEGGVRTTGGGNCVTSTLYAAYGTKWNGNAGAYNGDNFVLDSGVGTTEYLTGWDNQEKGNPACNQGGMAIVQTLYENHGQDSRYTGPLDVAQTVTAAYGMGGNNQPFVVNRPVAPIDRTPNGVSGTVSAKWAKGTGGPAGDEHYNQITQPTYTLDRESINCGQNFNRNPGISEDGINSTLNAQGPGAVALPPSYTVRRLTPTECERLQGFPDNYTNIPPQTEVTVEDLSFWREVWDEWNDINGKNPKTDKQIIKWLQSEPADSARYKALGNSFAIPNAFFVISRCVEQLRKEVIK